MLVDEILKLEENIQTCWEYFITSRIKEGMSSIYKIFGDLDSMINKVQNNNLINVNINDIENVFVSLEMALKVPDYVLIADLLNYELKTLIESWRINLDSIKQ